MYTEIDLSEFLIRARLKLGEMAYSIYEATKVGDDYQSMVKESADLRLFLNAVNSDYNNWITRDLYKRVEYFADRYDLVDKPIYQRDWLDKFKPVRQLVINNPNLIELPSGSGDVWVRNDLVYLEQDNRLTLENL